MAWSIVYADPVSASVNPIAADRRTTAWELAGVWGGIPTRNTIYTTLSSGASLATAQAAVDDCPVGQVVKLGTGTFNWASPLYLKTGITLRGSGAMNTKVIGDHWTVGAIGTWIQGGYGSTAQNQRTWSAGYAQDTTVVTLSSVANLSVGDVLVLEQLNDANDTDFDHTVYVCNAGQVCAYTSGSGDYPSGYSQRQLAIVDSINGNNVTLRVGLHMPNWRSGRSPQARYSGSAPPNGIGVEDMTIETPDVNDGGTAVRFDFCRDVWVTGCRILGCGRSIVNFYGCVGVTFMHNYLWGGGAGVSTSYGVELFGASSDVLIENNIVQHNSAPIIVNDGGSNIVIGFNLCVDPYRTDDITLQPPAYHIHSPGTGMVLLEGNEGYSFIQDDWYGSVNFCTAHRNFLYGDIWASTLGSPTKDGYTSIMLIAAYSRCFNFTGNVLGKTGLSDAYQAPDTEGSDTAIWLTGYSHANGGVTDTYTRSRMMRWGNYDIVTATVRWETSEIPSGLTYYDNPIPATQTLPTSYYLSAKPSWFGSITWPCVGPDVTSGNVSGFGGYANKNPARVAFESMTLDSAYSSYPASPPSGYSGNNWRVRQFDPQTLYGI